MLKTYICDTHIFVMENSIYIYIYIYIYKCILENNKYMLKTYL